MNDSINNVFAISTEIFEPAKKPEKKIKKIKTNKNLKSILFLFFIFLGILNHLGYYLIMTSSQQFATKLGNESLIACYPLALILFSSFARVINSKFCINISYYIRLIILSSQFCIGYIALFFILDNRKIRKNNNITFWLTMLPTTILGMGESFGEVTILGYIGTFKRNDYLSGWAIGGSLAGVFGSILSLLFKKLNTNLKMIYLFLTPISILYFFIFLIINHFGKNEKKIEKKKEFHKIHEKTKNTSNIDSEDEITKNKILNIKNFIEGFKSSHKYIINLAIINFLQHLICYCFCERANKYKFINSKGTYFEKAQYETLLLFYEFGFVLSSACTFIIRNIKYLEIFTYLQFINTILWAFESLLGFVSNQWICYIHLFFVGFCGGGGHVGFLDKIINSKAISKRIIELCLNISEFFIDWGILFSSLTSIIFDNTFLKTK